MPTEQIPIGINLPILSGVVYATPSFPCNLTTGGTLQVAAAFGGPFVGYVPGTPVNRLFLKASGNTTVHLQKIDPWRKMISDPYHYQIAADGAVAFWRLSELVGTQARDSIGNAHGTISGGVSLGQVGVFDSCMKFDGSGAITTPPFLLAPSYTMEAWIRFTLSGQQAFLSNYVGSVAGPATLYVAPTGALAMYIEAQNPSAGPVGVRPLGDNQWHHVVGTHDGTTARLYVDGVLDNEIATSHVTTTGATVGTIGRHGTATQFFNGQVDEVAIYHKALTPAQIKSHYDARNPNSYESVIRSSSPSYYWRLNESSGLVAKDEIGGANGTISGGVTLNQEGAMYDSRSMLFTAGGSISVPVTNLSLSLTIEAWIKLTSLIGGFGGIFSNRGAPNGFMLATLESNLCCYSDNSTPNNVSTPQILTLGWHHVALVRNSSTSILYVDGISYQFSQTHTLSVTGSCRISDPGNGNGFLGNIDEVAVYYRALSPNEILSHYNARLSPYAKEVYRDKPSNYWRLNEVSGTTAADIVGGAHGTISGGVTLGQTGVLSDDKGMVFNGTTGKIRSTSIPSYTPPCSFDLWFKTSVSVTTNTLISTFGDAPYGVTGHFDCRVSANGGNTIEFFLYPPSQIGGVSYLTSTPGLNDGQWHHLAVVFLGADGDIYIDGILRTKSDPLVYNGTVNKALDIGYYGAGPAYFNGTIDEVAIYPYALSASQIANHYRARR